jgi:hypothetical protein
MHNKLVRAFRSLDPSASPQDIFVRARNEVIWRYQRIVWHQFLPDIIEASLLDRLKSPENNPVMKRLANHPRGAEGALPVEYAFAAYRFGHSQVRAGYALHRNQAGNIVGRRTFDRETRSTTLAGGQLIDNRNALDWRFFTEVPGHDRVQPLNRTRPIDAFLAEGLDKLTQMSLPPSSSPDNVPNPIINLALRNLLRSYQVGLQSGQSMATALGLTPLKAKEINFTSQSTGNPIGDNHPLFKDTPLWLYSLAEAAAKGGGKLTGVGGTIVGGTILAHLQLDPSSVFNQTPEVARVPYTVGDLVIQSDTPVPPPTL